MQQIWNPYDRAEWQFLGKAKWYSRGGLIQFWCNSGMYMPLKFWDLSGDLKQHDVLKYN